MNPNLTQDNKRHAAESPGAARCHDLRRGRRWDERREIFKPCSKAAPLHPLLELLALPG